MEQGKSLALNQLPKWMVERGQQLPVSASCKQSVWAMITPTRSALTSVKVLTNWTLTR